MKILLVLTTIFNITTLSNFGNVVRPDNKIVFKQGTDEQDLEQTRYKAGSKPYKKPLVTINKKTWNTYSKSVEYKVDFDLLYDLIYEQAKSSGLLNGATPFEKIKKNQLFIDARQLMIDKMEIKTLDPKTNKIKINKRNNNVSHSQVQMLLKDSPTYTFHPVSRVKEINFNFQFNLNGISFADIKNVSIDRTWGFVFYGKESGNQMFLKRLLKNPNLTKDEETSFNVAFSDFIKKLKLTIEEENRISSDDFDIVKTNQGSEKFGYIDQGYNIKVPIDLKEDKPLFPVHLLLLPLLLILLPYSYFTIKKIINK